jgi:uncharacterized cofD-like protein
MQDALFASKAHKYWIMNIMTQRGETKDYTLSDHVRALENHCDRSIVDSIIYSNSIISEQVLERYSLENAKLIENDLDDEIFMKYDMQGFDCATVKNGLIRHNSPVIWDFISTHYESKN